MARSNNPDKKSISQQTNLILKKLARHAPEAQLVTKQELENLVRQQLHALLFELKKQADAKRIELKEQKLNKIMNFLSENATITNRQIRKITDVSEMTAVYYLRELIEREKIERLNKGRNVVYKLR